MIVNYPATPNPSSPADNVYPLSFIPVADRFQPCRVFRISPDHLRLERSLDSGATWTTVLDGGRVPAGTTPPNFRSLVVAAPGRVVVTETANNDGLVESIDGGTTWTLASGGVNDAANLIGEFPSAVVAGPTAPDGGIGVLYVATLACASHTRPHASPDCDATNSSTGHLSTGETRTGNQDLGPVRLYASHDGGHTWQRFADSATGIGADCSVAFVHIIPDPFSVPSRDHLWMQFGAAGVVTTCTGGTTEMQGDGAGGYSAPTLRAITGNVAVPFAVTHGPNGLRLVSGDYLTGYSDDDGATWTPMEGVKSNHPYVASVVAGAQGALLSVAFHEFPYYDGGWTTDFRPIVRRPSNPNGISDVELGAALPPPPGQPDRTLFNYPHYDPLIPTLAIGQEILGATNGPSTTDITLDGQGNAYVAVGAACYSHACRWDGQQPDSRAGAQPSPLEQVAAQWQLMRYTLPVPGSLPVLENLPSISDQQQGMTPHTSASCKNQGRCDLVPIHSCSVAAAPYAGGPDHDGTLAFDGSELLYTRSSERSAADDPYSAVIRRMRADATQCVDTGAIVVHFPSQQYDQARALTWADWSYYGPWLSQPQVPAVRPLIDSLTYDATHDRVYFTLRTEGIPSDNGQYAEGEADGSNQLSLWSADLHSHGGIPSASVTASLVSLTTGHCTSSNAQEPGAGSRTLAFDRIGDNLAHQSHPDGAVFACLPSRPAELDTGGRQIDQPCYGSYEMTGHNHDGMDVASWTMEDLSSRAGRHRAFLYLDEASSTGAKSAGRVAVYDLTTCQEDRLYTFPASGHLASTGSTSLACDSVTFGTGTQASVTETAQLEAAQQVPPFTGTLQGAVLWSKVGSTLTANLIPDNGDAVIQSADPFATQTCRLPVDLAYTGPATAQPGATVILGAQLSVQGPHAPIADQPVTVQVDGALLGGRPLSTDAGGLVQIPFTMPSSGAVTVTVSYDPPAGNVAYYSAPPVSVTLGAPAPAQVPLNGEVVGPTAPRVAPPAGFPAPPLPVGAPVPVPIPAIAAAVAPAQGGQTNTVSQGQGQPAAAREREEEQELALALADDENAEAAAEGGVPPGEGAGEPATDATYQMMALHPADADSLVTVGGGGVVAAAFSLAVALRRRQRPEVAHASQRDRRAGRRRRRSP